MQKDAIVIGECSQYEGEGDDCKLSLWSFSSDQKKGGEDKSEIESGIDQIDADDSSFNGSHKTFQETSLNLELSMALPLSTVYN